MKPCDVAVIGGGIIGLASADRLLQTCPRLRLVVLEKEADIACHQSGRNSGVLHSGIYYRPGSLKARNCRAGKEAMEAFCRREGVPYEICGKVIVATSPRQRPTLDLLLERGRANGVKCRLIGPEELRELEPHAAGVAAIHVPEAGIVDFRAVCRALARRIARGQGEVRTGAKVVRLERFRGEWIITTTGGEYRARFLVNCAGLYCDQIMRLAGLQPPVRIVPFRGEFYELVPQARHLCRNLIYPVPDPDLPFLGVHFTRMIDGRVECGPNAVLALAREGYTWRRVRLGELLGTVTYRGFWRLSRRYWRVGIGEVYRSLRKAAFVRALQELVPEVSEALLVRSRSGVRAQAVDPEGRLVDDFLIQAHEGAVHVINAPSPAATSSLNIARLIVQALMDHGLQVQCH